MYEPIIAAKKGSTFKEGSRLEQSIEGEAGAVTSSTPLSLLLLSMLSSISSFVTLMQRARNVQRPICPRITDCTFKAATHT
jgi:hypothetical protein